MRQKVPDTGGVYLVPAFTGLGAPYWDMYARGCDRGPDPRSAPRNILSVRRWRAIAYQIAGSGGGDGGGYRIPAAVS